MGEKDRKRDRARGGREIQRRKRERDTGEKESERERERRKKKITNTKIHGILFCRASIRLPYNNVFHIKYKAQQVNVGAY